MTLDEAIEHADERATACDDECGQEHEQLAEWLRELRDIRKVWNNIITAYDGVCRKYNESDDNCITTINYLYGKLACAEAENEKLRELARDMNKAALMLCEAWEGSCSKEAEGMSLHEVCPIGDTSELCLFGRLNERMHELGIGV